MVSREFSRVVRQLRRITRPSADEALSDAQLLECFGRGDEAAFELLLARHGPMVLALCRRLLRDNHDAEDAFQATWLVLVRKAGSLRAGDLLGNWLYGVAYRIAVRVRANKARQHALERSARDRAGFASEPNPEVQDLRWLLQEELSRLPDKYRRPVVLCYLEGQTNEQAARLLCWPLGTVKGRLTRARELLRRRLTRRGVTLSSAALAAALSSDSVTALPPPLIVSTAKAAQAVATGKAAALGGVSATVLRLVNGSLRTMLLARVKSVAAVVLALAAFVPGGALLAPALTMHPIQAKSDSADAVNPDHAKTKPATARTQTPDLRTRFVTGQPFYLEITTETKQLMTVMQMDVTQDQLQTFWTRWTPLRTKDSKVLMKLEILGVKMDIDVGGNQVHCDSRIKNPPAGALNDFCSKLKGAEVKFWLDTSLKTEKYLTFVEEPGPLRSPLSESAVRDWSHLLDRAPPGRVIHPGDTWTMSSRQSVGVIGQFQVTNAYTYEGPAGALDRIKVKSTLKYTAPRLEDQDALPFRIQKANFKPGSGSGTLLFDPARGRLVRVDLQARIEGTLVIDIAGTSTEARVLQTQRTTARTSDTNPLQ